MIAPIFQDLISASPPCVPQHFLCGRCAVQAQDTSLLMSCRAWLRRLRLQWAPQQPTSAFQSLGGLGSVGIPGSESPKYWRKPSGRSTMNQLINWGLWKLILEGSCHVVVERVSKDHLGIPSSPWSPKTWDFWVEKLAEPVPKKLLQSSWEDRDRSWYMIANTNPRIWSCNRIKWFETHRNLITSVRQKPSQ